MSRDTPWTYDDFRPSAEIGSAEVVIDAQRIGLWNRIYAPAGGAAPADGPVPPGLVVAAMMEGFIRAIQPRPPGNIHAGQTLAFAGAEVRAGARLTVTFTCKAREIRRERRWVTFGVSIRDGGRLVAEGEIAAIWAK